MTPQQVKDLEQALQDTAIKRGQVGLKIIVAYFPKQSFPIKVVFYKEDYLRAVGFGWPKSPEEMYDSMIYNGYSSSEECKRDSQDKWSPQDLINERTAEEMNSPINRLRRFRKVIE